MWITSWLSSRDYNEAWKADGLRVRNGGLVVPGIFRGARPAFSQWEGLRKVLGVERVLNLMDGPDGDKAAAEATANGLDVRRVPFSDKEPPEPYHVGMALAILSERIDHPVFLHCAGGRHRTGGLVAAYRMQFQGWTNARAYEESEHYGMYSAQGHKPWVEFIKSYTPTRPAGMQTLGERGPAA